jgi:DNA-binding CsgD family transcriptional regulator/tetratricopeptide (TPR) repeat protein
MEVIGRETEFAVVDRLLQSALDDRSQILILRGEAGIGKSVFLDAVAERARGRRILRATGVESEIAMPFAGLHQLLWPILDRIDRLAEPQADALRGALGLGGQAGNIFLVGVALLSLLAEVAEEQPLLFLVDDAHWLDEPSASALAFAARRLEAEPIAGLIAVRKGAPRDFVIPNVPVLDIKGLSVEAATHLFDELGDRIAATVRHWLIVETGGNPLALKELPSALSSAQLAGTSPLPSWLPLPDRLAHAFRERVRQLPAPTQRLLLFAAADDWLGLDVLATAAAQMGASATDLDPAEQADLIRVEEGRVGFRHPLVRSSVYQGAAEADRLAVHRALAQALVRSEDQDRRVWHLAAATIGTDEEVATELEAVADRTERRRGPAAAAASLERSAHLAEDSRLRAHRLTRAAGANLEGGRRERTLALLAEAESIAEDPRVRAQIIFCRARLVMQTTTSTEADVEALLEGASLVERSDPELAANILSLSGYLAWFARDWSLVTEVARRLLSLDLPPDSLHQRRAQDIIGVAQEGGTLRAGYFRARYESAAYRRLPAEIWLPPPPMVEVAGAEKDAFQFLQDAARDLRSTGTIWGLMPVLAGLGRVEYLLGYWSRAVTHLSEAVALALQTGHEFHAGMPVAVLERIAAIRGDAAQVQELSDQLQSFELSCSLGGCVHNWAQALFELGQDQAESAFERLASMAPLATWPNRNQVALRATGDLALAAVQTGRVDAASQALAGLERWAGASPPAWAEVTLHRSRALLAQNQPAAEMHFRAALGVSGAEGRPWEHARTHLLYGQWLRQRKRKVPARVHLWAALETFDQLGAQPWSQRTRKELRSAGERMVRPDHTALEHLSPQELQIASLAAQGLTNRQIGEHLFLSPRTIGTHLYRLFPKLGIASRSDLKSIRLIEVA